MLGKEVYPAGTGLRDSGEKPGCDGVGSRGEGVNIREKINGTEERSQVKPVDGPFVGTGAKPRTRVSQNEAWVEGRCPDWDYLESTVPLNTFDPINNDLEGGAARAGGKNANSCL